MKFLHTSDWHIGQYFYDYSREYEHRIFLNWLIRTITDEKIDVLLISGDIFDVANPSAQANRMFYEFLVEVTDVCRDLQIIAVAGNHDSATRFETPQPFVERKNIHLIGSVKRDQEGNIDFDSVIVPLKNKNNETEAWCIAAPFLRMSDYPTVAGSENAYSAGVASFYKQAYEAANMKRTHNEAIIAMGHLHTNKAEIGDLQTHEREIMGGMEGISADTFHPNLSYVALGHIHKAQSINDSQHIRYSGSPLPMSFSELNYKHSVTLFEIVDGKAQNLQMVAVPVSIPLKKIAGTREEILGQIENIERVDEKTNDAPYLEIRVRMDAPDPSLKYRIEAALEDRNVRLAKIAAENNHHTENEESQMFWNMDDLKQIQPIDLLQKAYKKKHGNDLPEHLKSLFHRATQQAMETEDE